MDSISNLDWCLTLTFGAGYLTLHFISCSVVKYRLIVVNVELECAAFLRSRNVRLKMEKNVVPHIPNHMKICTVLAVTLNGAGFLDKSYNSNTMFYVLFS